MKNVMGLIFDLSSLIFELDWNFVRNTKGTGHPEGYPDPADVKRPGRG
jgi:hypothetical protein